MAALGVRGFEDRGRPVDMGCQVKIGIALPWSIVSNILGECHAKHLLCRFRKRVGASFLLQKTI